MYQEEAVSAGRDVSPLQMALHSSSDGLSKLASMARGLAERLEPLLRSQTPEPAENRLAAAREAHSPLVGELQDHLGRIQDLQRTISSLLDRLEV